MKPRGYRLGMVVSLLALALAACSGSPSSSPGSQATASSTLGSGHPSAEVNSTPSAEPTGLETPQSPSSGGVSLSVANLPVGGGANDDTCLQVSWAGKSIPPGYVVTVTKVSIDAPFVVNGKCSGAPCDGGYQFRASNDNGCTVNFEYPGHSIDPNGADLQPGVRLDGQLGCPAGDSPACNAAAADIESSGGSQLQVDVHVASSSSATGSSTPAGTTDSPAATDSTSTQPVASSS